jgi:hypothetical protein
MAARVVPTLVVASLATATVVVARERPYRVHFTSLDVRPGQDRLACEYLELPNPTLLDVRRFVVRARPRIHHVTIAAYVGENRNPQYWSNGIGAILQPVGP